MQDAIKLKGASIHNLKNISVNIPRYSLTVITGISGSGKTSLAFDTIYAEGYRKYAESLTSYIRQFLLRINKPPLDFIEGMSPAIAVRQHRSNYSIHSIVATKTELLDYIRLLYVRIGHIISPNTGKRVVNHTPQLVWKDILSKFNIEDRFYILFPAKGYTVDYLIKKGFSRIYDTKKDTIVHIDVDFQSINKNIKSHYVLVDRLILKDDNQLRLRTLNSIEIAFKYGKGECAIKHIKGSLSVFLSRLTDGIINFEEPILHMFSLTNPRGVCENCQGHGKIQDISENKVIPDTHLTLNQDAIKVFTEKEKSGYKQIMVDFCIRKKIPLDVSYKNLNTAQKQFLWNGDDKFIGINGVFDHAKKRSYKIGERMFYNRYREYIRCPNCDGYRFRKETLYIKLNGLHIGELLDMDIKGAGDFFNKLSLTKQEKTIAMPLLKEINSRLHYLCKVGVDYLRLTQNMNSLSGGENQRIQLANALGSALLGSVYIMDEPTIGLHARDVKYLIDIMMNLRDMGNTIIVVEHDLSVIEAADYVIDIGPNAGQYGGEIVFQGTPKKLLECKHSISAHYMRIKQKPFSKTRRKLDSNRAIKIYHAQENNLKDINVTLPLGGIVCITGVSGSGKSTLVKHILCGALKRYFYSYSGYVGKHKNIQGMNYIDGVEIIDQTAAGRSSRSNPATYAKLFDVIRELFSHTNRAKQLNLKPKHFSFNTPGGRCETCLGEGIQKIDMQFMADLELECEICKGKRFQQDILEVLYRGKSIYDVLNMHISEAGDFFADIPLIAKRIENLIAVGLGYLTLGQNMSTLSGGEAQRIKIAKFLSSPSTSSQSNLFIFDEPTTGLHIADIDNLLKVFNRLIHDGHSIIVVEHNMEVIKHADWIIDLGPEGGYGGGNIIYAGTPEDIINHPSSYTGKYLHKYIHNE